MPIMIYFVRGKLGRLRVNFNENRLNWFYDFYDPEIGVSQIASKLRDPSVNLQISF